MNSCFLFLWYIIDSNHNAERQSLIRSLQFMTTSFNAVENLISDRLHHTKIIQILSDKNKLRENVQNQTVCIYILII